jgi:hypothetical protein
MARKVRIKDEERSRIVLSREKDIERLHDERERINQQLEMYMKQYADLTGEKRLANNSYRDSARKSRSLKITLITLAAIVLVVGAFVVYKLLA